MTHDVCPVMLFSGKGGVGKTTLAAATAVRLAQGGSRVLVVSTDPAHSLSDVFDVQLGAEPVRIGPNLEAMEVDAEGMFLGSGPSEQEAAESPTLARLVKMASETPGVDEFGAIEVLLRALEDEHHDVVILDTAPTGHTLRLLMLPELLDGWLGTLLQLREQIGRAGRLLRRLLPRVRDNPRAKSSRAVFREAANESPNCAKFSGIQTARRSSSSRSPRP
jgi:arsenite-transporting ATPase